MTVRPMLHRATVPAGVAALGALILIAGWLVMNGLPFALGWFVIVTAALGGVSLLLASEPDER